MRLDEGEFASPFATHHHQLDAVFADEVEFLLDGQHAAASVYWAAVVQHFDHIAGVQQR